MIRVMLAEDSATARARLRALLEQDGEFEIVGEAGSGAEAVDLAARARPQLVALDVFLPDLKAAEVVRQILALHPVPIVLVSDASRYSDEAFEALAAGALEWVPKPRVRDVAPFLELLRSLSRVLPRRRGAPGGSRAIAEVVVVASSAGGPDALGELLAELAPSPPLPVVVAQHLTKGSGESFSAWLRTTSGCPVEVAKDGAPLRAGEVLLCPPGFDIEVLATRRVRVSAGAAGGLHPSADVLLASGAAAFGAGALGVVLSGIGSDGRRGARVLASVGGRVLVQDPATSAACGMPEAVARAGISCFIGPPRLLGRVIAEAGRLPSPSAARNA